MTAMKRMRARRLFVAFLLMALMPCANASEKVFRVGFVSHVLPKAVLENAADPRIAAFVEALRQRGWQDGKNIRIVWRTAEGDAARHFDIVRELVQMPVDVIVAFGPALDAAARATKTIPIVGYYTDFVGSGYAASLARPGGNVTGLTAFHDDGGVTKQLEFLKKLSPAVRRVGVVKQVRGSSADRFPDVLQPLAQAAAALDLELFLLTFGDMSTLDALVASAVRQGAHALLFSEVAPFHLRENQQRLAAAAARHRIPVLSSMLPAADAGVLMAYGIDTLANYPRFARMVDRILRGEKAGSIPIEQPGRIEFHVNLEAAKAIGLQVPPALLLQADKVYE